jgi:hypothetical protein
MLLLQRIKPAARGSAMVDSVSLLAEWILQDGSCTRHLPRLLAITLTEAQLYDRFSSSGSPAKFTANRRASSRASSLAAERRPGSSSK